VEKRRKKTKSEEKSAAEECAANEIPAIWAYCSAPALLAENR